MDPMHVLIIDDEPGMRAGVLRALRDLTVHVPETDEQVPLTLDQAEDAEVGLEKIGARPPDLLLLDHKLPGMSGLDVLERIGGEDQGVLTIMITAYASLETAVSATKRGAYDFLAKPFTPAELKQAVRKAVRHVAVRRQAQRLAAEKRRVRFEFISVLSHELKAPLGAVEGYLRILRDHAAGDDPADIDRMLDRCLIRLDGAKKLIFDLLDLTRIESGAKQRRFGTVDVREVARSAVETVTPQARDMDVTVALPDGPAVEMDGDRGEVEIILNNLVSNAVKYNRPGGRVDVSLDADDETVTVRVADTGIGMTAEEAGKLFEDFVRIRNEKTRTVLGSGLGLSTVRKLARLYGGDVTVDSEPDVGSTFTVTLGRHTTPEAATIEDAQKTGHPDVAARA